MTGPFPGGYDGATIAREQGGRTRTQWEHQVHIKRADDVSAEAQRREDREDCDGDVGAVGSGFGSLNVGRRTRKIPAITIGFTKAAGRSRGKDGEFVFTSPAGKSTPAEHSRVWFENIQTWLQEWAEEHGVDLGPDANKLLWDGTRPDYDLAVSG